MERTQNFKFLEEHLSATQQRCCVALACPHDSHTEYVIERALAQGFARFILTTSGPLSDNMRKVTETNSRWVEIRECKDAEEASRRAVAAAHDGEAKVLMKGTVNTDVLLRAVLDKNCGLLKPGNVLTHITMSHIPTLGRMLMFSDAAVIPHPTLDQFDAIVRACVGAWHKLGKECPKVALTHCTEKINPKFEHTLSYAELITRAGNGNYGCAVVDGPMDVKTALDAESGAVKGICSPVAGNADVLVFPNIESGNTFYKTITLLAGATTAGWLAGTDVPVVVASRADSEESKYYSLAMASFINKQ